jgi:isocitrate dehydrogenase
MRLNTRAKDNIMKQTDGLFHKLFDEVAKEYDDIVNEHWIVDIGAAKLADTPEAFDVVVMPNLYGDILSDVAAQIAGSVGLAGSANIGENIAMFEAIHGSAPRRAGQNLANPSGLFLGAVLMLVHIGQTEAAERAHNAWLKTIEDGIHTYDIFAEGVSKEKVGTKEFAQAVVARLGQKPETLKAASYRAPEEGANSRLGARPRPQAKKDLVGVDVFLHWRGETNTLGQSLEKVAESAGLKLVMLSNRGVKVYPGGFPDTSTVDSWRCRFMNDGNLITHQQIIGLLGKVAEAGYDFQKTENLCNFDGERGYSLGQGQ